MQYLSRLKRRKGFTLTELIVVIAIIALLMSSVVAFAGPIRRMISGTDARSNTLTVREIIGSYMERNIAYAESVNIYTGWDYDGHKDSISYGSFDADNKKYCALIFHYEEATNEALSGYRIYEVVNYKNGTTGLPDLDNAADIAKAKQKYGVFCDGFYGNYAYFVAANPFDCIQSGGSSDHPKTYLSFHIDSYSFEDGSAIATGDFKSHYDHAFDSTIDDKMDTHRDSRTGGENPYFRLENAKSSAAANISVGYSEGVAGDDLIIVYTVKTL